MRNLGLIILAVIAIGGAYFGYQALAGAKKPEQAAASGPPGAGGPPMGLPVEAVTVQPEPFVDTITAVGTLMADEAITVRPEVAGKIETIAVQEGEPVKKGQLLFALDEKLMKAERDEAAAQSQQAKIQADRLLKVSVQGAISASERDVAQQSKLAAIATYSAAQERLAKARIFAPFDGVVGLRQVSPGAVVEAGATLTTLQKLDPIKVEFTVPEKQSGILKIGQDLEFTIPDQPGKSWHAQVYAFEPSIDAQGRFVAVRAKTDNKDHALKPGSYVNVQLAVAQKTDALLVPEQAIIPMGNNTVVMTIVDGKAAPAPVTVGARMNGKAEILTGLKPGDQVMTAGFMKAQPGAPVMVIQKAEAGNQKPEGAAAPADPSADSQSAAPAAGDAAAPAQANGEGAK